MLATHDVGMVMVTVVISQGNINRRRAVRTFWFLKVEGGYLPCGDYAYSPPVVVRIVDGGNSDMRRLSCNAQE